MMRRPASVPRAARYSTSDGWWQVGRVRDGQPYGRWRTFRADGSPLFEAGFDDEGRLAGLFRRFHPDGTVARTAKYKQGEPDGEVVYVRAKAEPGDVFPSSDARVRQIVVRYAKGELKSRKLLDAGGQAITDVPPSPDDLPDVTVETEPIAALDLVFADAEPDGFLASGAVPQVIKALTEALGAAEPARGDDFMLPHAQPARRPLDGKRFQDLYGKPMAPALRAWLEATAGSPRLLGYRAALDNDLAVTGNLVEALILEHQAAPGRAVGLRALVSGLVPIGEHDRHAYCAAVCEAGEDAAKTDAVYTIAVTTDSIQMPVARTIDDFAFAATLASAADAGLVSRTCLVRAYERLRGRVDLRAPMAGVEATALDEGEHEIDDEIAGDEEGDHREGFHFRRANAVPAYFFYRNRWLLRLLCGHVEGAAEDFDIKYDGGLDDTRFETVCKHVREPWVAFYWLFRSLVFADPRLPTLVRVPSDVPSQLSRDIAALVGELAGGRKRVGEVENFPAAVARFIALDPMANKPDDDGDEEAAPPPKLEVPAELAAAAAVIDWARAEGYSREGLLMDDELDAAGVGLALRADPRIVPYIADIVEADARVGSRLLDPWLDGDRANLGELAAKARAWLGNPEAGIHAWELGAKILARAGGPDDAALLAKVVEPALDAMFTRPQGFAERIGYADIEDAVAPLLDAITTLGIPESLVSSLEGVCTSDNHLVDDARGPCALALATMGRGLDAIVVGIKGQVEREHGHAVTSGQFLAVGALGKRESEARRRELAELVEAIEPNEDAPKLGRLCALHDLRGGIDLAEAAREALAEDHYSEDSTARARRALLAEVIARRPDLPADLAGPYVHSFDIELHRLAVRTLRARGAAVPETRIYDPYLIATLTRDQLHAALADDRGIYRSNIALWLGDHPDESSRQPLIDFARRIAITTDRDEFPDDGPEHYELRWTVRALLKIGGAEAMFDELLRADDRNVAEPVLRYPEQLGPAVARGMVHTFETDEHWKHGVAKKWLVKHAADPAVVAALAEAGLSLADVKRLKKTGEEE